MSQTPEDRAAQRRAYYLAHKTTMNAQGKAYYWSHKDTMRKQSSEERAARSRAYYVANRDRLNAQSRAYQNAHKEILAAKAKERYLDPTRHAHRNAYSKAYKAAHRTPKVPYTHCQRGHALPENRRSNKCRICQYETNHRWRAAHLETAKARTRKKILDRKIAVFMAYGGCRCVLCGETDLRTLSLDHINNDGNIHRKQLGQRRGGNIYQWAVREHFPPGLQVLCMSCQWAKRFNGGVLPENRRDIRRTNVWSVADAERAMAV